MTRTKSNRPHKSVTQNKSVTPNKPTNPIKSDTTPSIPPPNQEPSFLKQMAGTVLQGFAFGTGSSIAHKTIDNLSTPNDTSTNTDTSSTNVDTSLSTKNGSTSLNCNDILTEYNICVKNNSGLYCEDIIKSYNNCIQQRNAIQ